MVWFDKVILIDLLVISASLWLEKCYTSYVVDDIVRNGCHFLWQWDISLETMQTTSSGFRFLRQNTLFELNTCALNDLHAIRSVRLLFLCVIINKGLNKALEDEDYFLCFYYIKTAVFWSIQCGQYLTPLCPKVSSSRFLCLLLTSL